MTLFRVIDIKKTDKEHKITVHESETGLRFSVSTNKPLSDKESIRKLIDIEFERVLNSKEIQVGEVI